MERIFGELVSCKRFINIKNKCDERPLFSHRFKAELLNLLTDYHINDPQLRLLPVIAEVDGVSPNSILYDDTNFNHYETLSCYPEEYAEYGGALVIGNDMPKAIQERIHTIHRRPNIEAYKINAEHLFLGFYRDLPIAFRWENDRFYGLEKVLPRSHQLLNLIGGIHRDVLKEPIKTFENAIFIGDSFAFSNYAHWTLDWLPRLKWFQHCLEFKDVAIVFNRKPLDFHISMLERIGFNKENIVYPSSFQSNFLLKQKIYMLVI